MNVVYRVILKVGYQKGFFDFVDSTEAVSFAHSALTHSAGCEDTDKNLHIDMRIIDKDKEESEEE